jgi:hypothetical protein
MQKLWIEVYCSLSGAPGSFQLKTVDIGYPIGFRSGGLKRAIIFLDLKIRDMPLYKPTWLMGEWLLLMEQGARPPQETVALICGTATERECSLTARA